MKQSENKPGKVQPQTKKVTKTKKSQIKKVNKTDSVRKKIEVKEETPMNIFATDTIARNLKYLSGKNASYQCELIRKLACEIGFLSKDDIFYQIEKILRTNLSFRYYAEHYVILAKSEYYRGAQVAKMDCILNRKKEICMEHWLLNRFD